MGALTAARIGDRLAVRRTRSHSSAAPADELAQSAGEAVGRGTSFPTAGAPPDSALPGLPEVIAGPFRYGLGDGDPQRRPCVALQVAIRGVQRNWTAVTLRPFEGACGNVRAARGLGPDGPRPTRRGSLRACPRGSPSLREERTHGRPAAATPHYPDALDGCPFALRGQRAAVEHSARPRSQQGPGPPQSGPAWVTTRESRRGG